METTLTRRDVQLLESFSIQLLKGLGLLKEIMTASEIVKLYGRAFYRKARLSNEINWIKKGGKTSSTYCSITEFMGFLFKTELEFDINKLVNKN